VYVLGYAYHPTDVNETVLWEGSGNPVNLTVNGFVNYDYYVVRFEVGKASSFEFMTPKGILLSPILTYYIYNSTIPGERPLGGFQLFNALNDIYIPVRAEESKPLSEPTFQDFSNNIFKTLNFLQTQVMVLDIGIVILSVLLIVMIFFVRRKR
jgi:hypothetical protein